MNKDQMNALYAVYADSPDNLEALLVAIRRRAMTVMQDEDAAQEFTIGVWQALPIPHNANFSAWLNVRLRMKNLNWIRGHTNEHEMSVYDMPIPGDEGAFEHSLNERLDYFSGFARQEFETLQKDEERTKKTIEKIEDPFIRRVAWLIYKGRCTTSGVSPKRKVFCPSM